MPCGWVGNTQQCHAKTGGTGRKDDWQRTFPGCGPHRVVEIVDGFPRSQLVEGCHKEAGRIGVKTFAAKYGKTQLEFAAETQRRYTESLAHHGWSA